jgi:hypothetical protein
MNPETLASAANGAGVAWELAIQQLGWGAVLFALAYLVNAWLCFVCGYAAGLGRESGRGWFLCCGLLLLLALETVFQSHVFVLEFVRSLAKALDWYKDRRQGQFYLIALGVATGLLFVGWLRARLAAVWTECAPAVAGVAFLITVFLLKALSFHDTDAVLDLSIAGLPVSRFVELAGLMLTATGALRWLSTR